MPAFIGSANRVREAAGVAEFDYVIIGAGSAGCVLANRLSADPLVSVCLIEAGPPDRSPLIHVPLGILFLLRHRTLDWGYTTEPQVHAAGRRILVPRGKTLGGTSAINAMVYMRGHPRDYDEWADWGNPGWSFAEVLPYFRASEHNEVHGAPWHGTDGPMNVTDCESYSPLVPIMCDAARSMGWDVNQDFNGASQNGFGRRQVTMRDGRRESTATAFLKPAQQRKNLTVLTGVLADRVVLEDRRATGVEVIVSGERQVIAARREVILSAGAIASPNILQRSGIGDAGEIAAHGITPVHHLPAVGRNLQDHLLASIHHTTTSTLPYGMALSKLAWGAWQLAKYALFRKGMLANTLVHAGGFVCSTVEQDRPDLQFILLPANRTPENPSSFGHGYGIAALLQRPLSSGRVGLSAAAADAAPVIDPCYLSEAADRDLLLKGMRMARALLAQPAWSDMRGPEILPGPQVQTDADMLDYISRACASGFHHVGTCRMGPNANEAVVDARLRVHGIESLRVVDAAIMPRIIGGNTNAPTIMIAEKAADMILNRAPRLAERVF